MAGTYTVSVVDMAGRKMHEERILNLMSGKEVVINLERQPSQLYIVLIRNEKNELVETRKIIKQN